MWRARFGRGFGPVVKQTAKWMNMVGELSQRLARAPENRVATERLAQVSCKHIIIYSIFFCGATAPSGPRPTLISRLHDHVQTYHTR
jgi:hypothetical protein